MNIHNQNILVLNRNWQAISTTSAYEAFSQLTNETARGLAIDDVNGMAPLSWENWKKLEILEGDQVIGTPNGKIKIPKIIILSNYSKQPMKTLKFGIAGLWKRDKGICQYTGKKLKKSQANIDHIIPQSKGGDTSWENCVLSDIKVNQKKADRTPRQAGLRLLNKPIRPAKVPSSVLIENKFDIPEWNMFLFNT